MLNASHSFHRAGMIAGLLALSAAALGCGGQSGEIRDQRVIQPDRAPQTGPAPMSTGERFGFRQRPEAASQPAAPAYTWTAPASWEVLPSEPLRPANFRAGESGEIEVYLSVLGGTGGGIEANVNRWRNQMGLPDLDSEEVAALPTASVLGQEAVLIDFEGHYGGMNNEADLQAARMLGAILLDGEQAVFVKLVGPAGAVGHEREQFDSFVASLEKSAGQAVHAHAHGEGNWQHPPMGDESGWVHPPIEGQTEWAHPPMGDSMGPLAFESERPSGLHWEAPEGWHQEPDRPVRLVTFRSGPSQEVETYVTILSGSAGGVSANINRWREEMGQARLNEMEIAALPEVAVLGETAKFVEVSGNYSGKTGDSVEEAKMLGLIATLESQVLFVRMTGPQAVVLAERDNFIRFCESLQMAGGVS